jgi:subtilisin
VLLTLWIYLLVLTHSAASVQSFYARSLKPGIKYDKINVYKSTKTKVRIQPMPYKAVFSALLLLALSALPAQSSEKTFIVAFHQKPGPSEAALLHDAGGIIKRTYMLIPAMAVTLPEQAAASLANNRRVAYIEPNGIFKASDEYTDSWGVSHIGTAVVHSSGNRGAGVKIAVIDSGIDSNHPDLDDNYMGGYDFVFNDTDPNDETSISHGTHVSGIIAAEENGVGVIGVAPEADIYAVRVLDGAGFGTLEWIIAGIDWAVDNGMDIANLSLEGPDFQSLHDACDAAYAAGVLLVAAGGNTNGGVVRYPAAYSSVIAVTATDAGDQRAYFSPLGPALELAAPGTSILSTVRGGAYGFLSGTSQAAPHATGIAALFFAANPVDLNGNGFLHDEVRDMLHASAIDLGDPGPDSIFGYGLVNPGPFYICDCEGNFDTDIDVDGTDAQTFKTDFGRSSVLNPCTSLIPCNGDFYCDGDVDGSDASLFKLDFGRSALLNPCNSYCAAQTCIYP